MRVLMVSSLWPPHVLGGAERYAAALAAHLREAGHEVAALTLGVEGPDVAASVRAMPYRLDEFAGQPRHRRLVFHALDCWRPDAGAALRRAVSAFRPDVVHSHSVQGLSAAVLAGPARRRIPHVHTLHDYWLLCQRASLMRADGRRCDRRCGSCALIGAWRAVQLRDRHPDLVLSPSQALADRHAGVGWMRDRLRVLRHPVPPPPSVPRAAPPGAGPSLCFAFLGRLEVHKGVTVLLEAFRRARIPGATLRIAGEGPLARDVAAAGGGVEAVGPLDDAGRDALLARTDALVVPSCWEDPAPLVVNEARAAGVPVIGSRAGGIPELVPPAQQPLLVPPGDPGALAGALRRFAADPGRYRHGPEAGPGWAEHTERVVAAYRDAARPGGEPATAGQAPGDHRG